MDLATVVAKDQGGKTVVGVDELHNKIPNKDEEKQREH